MTMVFYGILVALALATLALYLGLRLARKLFHRERIGVDTAIRLLESSLPEEWNELRILNPEWIPKFSGADLPNCQLQSINFRGAVLDSVNFNGASLDGADFREASLKKASLQKASLRDANFRRANLRGADLSAANLSGAAFDNTDLEDAKLPAEARRSNRDREFEIDLDRSRPPADFSSSFEDLHPAQFESLVSELLQAMGYKIEITGGGHDQGFDLVATRADPIGGSMRFLVEVKRYPLSRAIGVAPLRALYGAALQSSATGSIIVTNSRFTRGAMEFAKNMHNLNLIDGKRLEELVRSWLIQPSDSRPTKRIEADG